MLFYGNPMSLHLFNPENDLALASGKEEFTPPKNALLLAQAGALLPMWLAEPGDSVLLRHGAMAADLPEWSAGILEGIGVTASADGFAEFSPWGWSKAAARIYRKAGSCQNLPDEDALDRHRLLSHRRSAADLNRILSQRLTFRIPDPAVEMTDARQLEMVDYPFYLKSPWSSTGRGVFHANSIPASELSSRAEGIIRRQGAVMVERALDGVRDFAMLFNIKNGKCRFEGYSLFDNSGTSYSGNILAGDAMLKADLAALVPEQSLTELEEVMPGAIEEIYGSGYEGNLGVDMLVYQDGNGYAIAPTIEVNLRNTMGFVARALSARLLHPDSTGTFSVSFGKDIRKSEPVFADGRLMDGECYPVGMTDGFTFKVTAKSCRL